MATENVIGSNQIYDLTTLEVTLLPSGNSLPIPNPGIPVPGIPPVIPILADPGISMSPDGKHMAFVKSTFDNPGIELYFVKELVPPIAIDDFATTDEDINVAIQVFDNDTDPNGESLSILAITNAQHGNATFNHNGNLIYRPDDNFFGSDSFTYTVHNSAGLESTATVHITVLPVNDAPKTEVDDYQLSEDASLVVSGPGVLGNDSDIDDSIITAQLITGPAHGSLSLGTNGSFTYTPDAHFNGTDSFLYAAYDGEKLSAKTLVTLVVDPLNDRPVNSLPAPVTAFEDAPVVITGISVSDVDAAEGSGLLEVTLQVAHGTLAVNESAAGGLAAGDIQGNQSSVVVLTGTQLQINTTLAAAGGFVYQGSLNFSGNDSLTVTTNDLGNFGAGGPLSDVDSLSIAVLSSAEQGELIADEIVSLAQTSELSRGTTKSLSRKILRSLDKLDAGRDAASINILRALAHEIRAMAQSGRITESERDDLLDGIGTLIVSIGVSDDSDAEHALLSVAQDSVFADVEILQDLLTDL